MLPNNLQPILIILLNLFWVPISTHYSADPVCGNAVIQCYDDYVLNCDITGLDTDLIQETLYDCAQDPAYDYLDLNIRPGGTGVTLNLTLPDNIHSIEIYNDFPQPIEVETSVVNMHLEEIYFTDFEIYLNHNDFFSYFRSLEYFTADIIGSEGMPIFSRNVNLTEIDVYSSKIRNESSRVITRDMIGGLYNLEIFYWDDGGVTEIRPDAFYGLTSLEELGLSYNDIHELYDCTFSDLVALLYLELISNDVRKVGEYAFIGLDAFEAPILVHNPSFPLNSLTLAKNITGFALDFYDPSLINAQFFQQFPNLYYLSFAFIPFDCSCEYEWISKLQSDFDFILELDPFTFCPGQPGVQVNDSSLYVNCSNNVTYQCFNHSIVCEGDNWLRVDSGNSCICTYPPERRLYNQTSFVCSDINECENESIICQGNCSNTIGSYTCACRDGYLNVNETTCSDVDECAISNGGCDQNCTNTIGSYNCTCRDGYLNVNETTCSDVDECAISNGGCDQNCTNTIGSYNCTCRDGYLNVNETTCSDVDECAISNGGCDQNCTNTIGSYNCTCRDGYLNVNETTCNDVNECMISNGGCDQNCTNTVGSYKCSCLEGFNVSRSNSSNCDSIIGATTSPRILNLTETEFSILVLAIIAILLILLVTICLILTCIYYKRRSRIPKHKPGSKPTIAELDVIKAEKELVIENPMSLYEVVPLETKKVVEGADGSLAPIEGTGTLTSELGVVSTDC